MAPKVYFLLVLHAVEQLHGSSYSRSQAEEAAPKGDLSILMTNGKSQRAGRNV